MKHIQQLLDFNLWATETVLDACDRVPREDLDRRFEIGLGTLTETMSHIVGAMERWAERIQGADDPASHHHEPEDLAGVRRHLIEADRALRAAAATAEQDGLEGTITIAIRGFEPITCTRSAALLHVLTHGVHHRAQVLNMLRHLGVDDLPDLDVISWELEAARAS